MSALRANFAFLGRGRHTEAEEAEEGDSCATRPRGEPRGKWRKKEQEKKDAKTGFEWTEPTKRKKKEVGEEEAKAESMKEGETVGRRTWRGWTKTKVQEREPAFRF